MTWLLFLWRHKGMIGIGVLAGLFLWLWWARGSLKDDVAELKERNALLETVVTEYEQAERELAGKVEYVEEISRIEADSAAAVAAGRASGDGPMAPVLHREYERVRAMAEQARP